MRVSSGARGVLLAWALATVAGPARAQEPEPAPGRDGARALVLREQLAPLAGQARSILGEEWVRFRATLDALAAQEARQRGLVGDVDFSFSADETGDFSGGPGNETLFGLRAGARLGGGGYRSRIGLLGDMRALIHDNVFEQDFSRVRLGYDHQRTDHLGAFAFIERYSDDAMSIAARYEIGGGVSMGVDLWPRRDDEAGARALAHLATAGPGGFRCDVERLRAGFDPAGVAVPPACAPARAAGGSPVTAAGANAAAASAPAYAADATRTVAAGGAAGGSPVAAGGAAGGSPVTAAGARDTAAGAPAYAADATRTVAAGVAAGGSPVTAASARDTAPGAPEYAADIARIVATGANAAAAGVSAYRPAAGGPRPDPAFLDHGAGPGAAGGTFPGGPRPDPAVFDALLDVVDPLERGLAGRQAMVSLSLGVGVFSEFENALIETPVSPLDPAGGPAVTAVPLPSRYLRVPGRHRYRFLLWPTITMRPLSSLSIEFIPSFKLPISAPRRFSDGVLYYRMDWFARIDWRPRRDDTFAGRTKLFVKFDYYKNMGPPVVADTLPPDAALEPLFYHRTGASKKHRFVSLGISFDLGTP